jgi:hypothetical protein
MFQFPIFYLAGDLSGMMMLLHGVECSLVTTQAQSRQLQMC